MNPELAGSQASHVAAKMLDRIKVCDSEIELYHSDSQLMDFANKHPEIKAETLRLWEEERQTLLSLDPLATSLEDIDEITRTYHSRRESLAPT
ncbi:MAG TPA: hypothetical protein VFH37_01890 [Candidatus Saccharimonadales bacterium]|nr:hypothetical protein [Candidatus Saccharimonadales bacterium]